MSSYLDLQLPTSACVVQCWPSDYGSGEGSRQKLNNRVLP